MSMGGNVKVTPFDISPKLTLFWGHKGHNPGSKWEKTCPYPYETRVIPLCYKLVAYDKAQ